MGKNNKKHKVQKKIEQIKNEEITSPSLVSDNNQQISFTNFELTSPQVEINEHKDKNHKDENEHKESLEKNREDTPKESCEDTPKDNPKESCEDTPKDNPKESCKDTPKKNPKEIIDLTPIEEQLIFTEKSLEFVNEELKSIEKLQDEIPEAAKVYMRKENKYDRSTYFKHLYCNCQ